MEHIVLLTKIWMDGPITTSTVATHDAGPIIALIYPIQAK